MQQSCVELCSDGSSRPDVPGGGGVRAAGETESAEFPSVSGGASASPGRSEPTLQTDGALRGRLHLCQRPVLPRRDRGRHRTQWSEVPRRGNHQSEPWFKENKELFREQSMLD